MSVLSVVWIPIMSVAEGGQIYRYATTVVGYFGAPSGIMFLMAILWGRVNEQVGSTKLIP